MYQNCANDDYHWNNQIKINNDNICKNKEKKSNKKPFQNYLNSLKNRGIACNTFEIKKT